MTVRTVSLGDVAEFVNGAAFSESDWSESGMKIIRIQNLTDPRKPFNRTKLKIKDSVRVRPGDLLVSWSATLGVFEWLDSEDALLNQHIFRVVPDPAQVDKPYLRHVLQIAVTHMGRHVHGATMKHINRGEFLATPIPLPSIEEQRRIAAILDTADALRTKRRLALAKLDALTQAIFIDMFGDPVSNQRSLPTVQLAEFGDLDRGVSKHRPRNDPVLLGGKWPLIQTGDVANSGGYITAFTATYSDLGLAQSKIWPKGTLCITIAANIAKTGILMFDACFPDSVVGFTSQEDHRAEYVRAFMRFLQPMLELQAPESAQKNINLKVLRSLEIPVPPDEQVRIFSAKVSSAVELSRGVAAHASRLDCLLASLQHRAFRGEL